MNLSGEPPTSQSRSSFGKANPITLSSREKASQTMRPTRNFTRPPTRASYASGSVIANRRTSASETIALSEGRLPQDLSDTSAHWAQAILQLRRARPTPAAPPSLRTAAWPGQSAGWPPDLLAAGHDRVPGPGPEDPAPHVSRSHA